MEIRKLRLDDPTFPAVLRDIPAPPKQLYVMGELQPLLARPRLAVVGSRKLTDYGRQATNQLVTEVVDCGVVIVSGLAFGVDSQAHEATLHRNGQTIAVLAGGLDQVTPVSHAPLAKRLVEQGGALVSEYPPGYQPQRHTFIARNRLVAGLSDAVMITQAGKSSGSLYTAQFALEQGKRVLAVPGSIYDEGSAGTNHLIRDYAIPVLDSSDPLVALGLNPRHQLKLTGNNDQQTTVLQLLQQGITAAWQLLEASQLDIISLNQTLSELEIEGRIRSVTGSQWQLSKW